MTDAIRDFMALHQVISRLPPPPQGHQRVFRGQTENFPAMLSSACRPGAYPLGKIWDIALSGVKELVAGRHQDVMAQLMDFGVWFKVLAQHYGPGSPFLDVTTEPEVALWFALNRALKPDPRIRYAVVKPNMPDIPVVLAPLTFAAHRDAPGWFYVLDFPSWSGKSMPEHGEIIDISKGPGFVSMCERVHRQKGALVMGDPRVGGGDLSGYYACPPIAVSRDFAGAPFIDRDALEIFPSFENDEWYRLLLRAPLIPHPSVTDGFAYRQSLGVYVVTKPQTHEEFRNVLDLQAAQTSELVRNSLRESPESRRRLTAVAGADPEAATYIQLEMPLFRAMPPVDTWNQIVLATGFARRSQPRVESSDEGLPAVTLENVLIEFSPLEYGFADMKSELAISAIWAVRREEGFKFVIFTAAPSGVDAKIIGPIQVRFSAESARFDMSLKEAWEPLIGGGFPPPFAKAMFIAMDILRGLSPAVKLDPYPTMIADGKIFVGVRRLCTVLARAKADPSDMRLHFLRNARTREPYSGPDLDLPGVGTLSLKSSVPYAGLGSLRQIYGRAVRLAGSMEQYEFAHEGEYSEETAVAVMARMGLSPG